MSHARFLLSGIYFVSHWIEILFGTWTRVCYMFHVHNHQIITYPPHRSQQFGIWLFSSVLVHSGGVLLCWDTINTEYIARSSAWNGRVNTSFHALLPTDRCDHVTSRHLENQTQQTRRKCNPTSDKRVRARTHTHTRSFLKIHTTINHRGEPKHENPSHVILMCTKRIHVVPQEQRNKNTLLKHIWVGLPDFENRKMRNGFSSPSDN